MRREILLGLDSLLSGSILNELITAQDYGDR